LKKIAFVTTNKGKFAEVARMLQERGHEAENISIAYPEIQADSLDTVVTHGLSWLMERYNRPLLVDDSGLFIDALEGFPGVYSSYVYRTIGCDGILKLIKDSENRLTHFECCLGFMNPGEEPLLFKGISEGAISTSKRGDKGFGFDPVFTPLGHEKTFAEMQIEQKNSLSHRGKAFEKFFEYLKNSER